ncbi:unnamed protein product [Porites evermanni]|uniref:Sushi domain-containing protein n=1 Tax=Porites evermanni TaxID=104178 RepID=A0ABN8S339_9CNID|nr:unnamed protein product [Porites evermanni]
MKRPYVFGTLFLFCWAVELTLGNLPKAPELGNGNLSCIDVIWDTICQVSCKEGFVPEKPHAKSYKYSKSTGTWTTLPEGGEFPWAPCVKRKSN